jgi:ABC-type multidrug transport system fused ATPase/permease subunit
MNKITNIFDRISDKATEWIGSTGSIIFHTIFFIVIFLLYFLHISFDVIMLFLTTIVSLEAIYLSIFIQRAVNKQRETLEDVGETLEDVEESLEDVEESLEDVEESIEEDDRDDDKVDKLIQKKLEEIISELKNKNHSSSSKK